MKPFLKKVVRGSKQHVEDDIQMACVAWFRIFHRGMIIFAIPNGARTETWFQAMRLKAGGLLKGIPDLCIPYARGNYHGLYIEMKSPTGRVTPEQRVILDQLAAEGYKTAVCRSLEEFQETVKSYFNLGRRIVNEQG